MKRILFILVFITASMSAKVLIMTHSYNRPDFIEIQARTLQASLQDEYEYVVFNDAPEEHMQHQIEQMCQKLGIRCIRVPQYLHKEANNTSTRHVRGIQYSLDTIGYDHNGITVIIDSDVFLLKPFSIEQYMKGYDLAGKLEGRANHESRVQHLSPVLVFMDMRTLPNKRTLSFTGGLVNGLSCDVGAHTYYYLKNNATLRMRFFNTVRVFFVRKAILHARDFPCHGCSDMTCPGCMYHLMDNGFDATAIQFVQSCPDDNVEFLLDHTFVHYRSGSNWNCKPEEYHKIKTQALHKLVDTAIEQHGPRYSLG